MEADTHQVDHLENEPIGSATPCIHLDVKSIDAPAIYIDDQGISRLKIGYEQN
jgi:hypothetical protein